MTDVVTKIRPSIIEDVPVSIIQQRCSSINHSVIKDIPAPSIQSAGIFQHQAFSQQEHSSTKHSVSKDIPVIRNRRVELCNAHTRLVSSAFVPARRFRAAVAAVSTRYTKTVIRSRAAIIAVNIKRIQTRVVAAIRENSSL